MTLVNVINLNEGGIEMEVMKVKSGIPVKE